MPESVKIIDSKLGAAIFNQIAIHPLQSWEWGDARSEMGIEVLRIGEFEQEELKKIFQVTFHPIPHTGYKIAYLPRSEVPSKKVMDFLYSFGKRHRTIFIKIEPYMEKDSQEGMNHPHLMRSSHPLFPEWTQMVDLMSPEEDLLKGMHQKTRYNINLAIRKGVVVREMSDERGFEIFIKLYFETVRRQRYFGHNRSYHKTVWRHLKNKIAHILIAFFENTPIAAFELFGFHDRFYYPYGGTSLRYRNTMASNLLMWEALRFAKAKGAKVFDMWGSLPPDYPQHHPWGGFTRFKEGYGSRFVRFVGSYDLVINPNLYHLYNIAYRIREVYLNFKR